MKKSQEIKYLNPKKEKFQALTEMIQILAQGRSDCVAIVGIIAIVIAFMTTTIIGGLVIYSLNINSQPSKLSDPNINLLGETVD